MPNTVCFPVPGMVVRCPLLFLAGCNGTKKKPPAPPAVAVAIVQRGNISHLLSVAGQFQAYQVVDVMQKWRAMCVTFMSILATASMRGDTGYAGSAGVERAISQHPIRGATVPGCHCRCPTRRKSGEGAARGGAGQLRSSGDGLGQATRSCCRTGTRQCTFPGRSHTRAIGRRKYRSYRLRRRAQTQPPRTSNASERSNRTPM